MTADPLLLALAAGGAVCLLAFLLLVLRNELVAVGALLVVWLLTVALRDAVDLSVVVAEVRVALSDVLAIMLAFVGCMRLLTGGLRSFGQGLVLLLFALVVIHIVRGISDFGLQEGINGGRETLYFVTAMLFAATVPTGWDHRVWKVLILAGLGLAAIAGAYFVAEGIGSSSEFILRNGEYIAARPIVAAGALLVLQAIVLALALSWPSPSTILVTAAGAAAILLLLQHRTLWIAGALVGIVGFLSWSASQRARSRASVFAATGVILLVLPAAALAFSQTGSLTESASAATTSDSTLVWRTDGWSQLLADNDTPGDAAYGGPAGESWARNIGGTVVEVSPHNALVEAYLRFGIPGTLILITLGVVVWTRRHAIGVATGLSGAVVALLLLTQLVYGFTYALDSMQGLIAGILVCGLAASREGDPAARDETDE